MNKLSRGMADLVAAIITATANQPNDTSLGCDTRRLIYKYLKDNEKERRNNDMADIQKGSE